MKSTKNKTKVKNSGNLIQLKSKNNYLNLLKLASTFLTSQNKSILQKIIETIEPDEINSIKYRTISNLLNYPQLIAYINSYLNNNYEFDRFELSDFLITLSILCREYKINSANKLYYSKFKTNKVDSFLTLIDKYVKEFDLDPFSDNEINNLIKLYSSEIITDDMIKELELIVSGIDKKSNTSKKTIEQVDIPQLNIIADIKTEDKLNFENLSPEIQNFCNKIKQFILKREVCKTCELYNKGSVILDTNLKTPGPVDICIVGLNPGTDELKQGLPFVGKSGKLLRKYLNPLIEKYNLTYVITNTILCSTSNAQEIKNASIVVKNCKQLHDEIKRIFHSKIIILLGNEAKLSVGIKTPITKVNGTFVDNYFIILHPSAILYKNSDLPKFEQAFKNLDEYLSKEIKKIKIDTINKTDLLNTNIKNNIIKSKIIDRLTNDLTLFDIKVLENKVLYILKDSNGRKLYHIQDFSIPIFIKSGQYKDCEYITTDIEAKIDLDYKQREKLLKQFFYNKRDQKSVDHIK